MPPRPSVDALRGSLDLLILKTLSLSAMHGWGISQRVQQMSGGEFAMNQGSLYPALQRLEKDGLITREWGVTDNNRQARYYRLTASGRRALGKELESWKKFVAALNDVLGTTGWFKSFTPKSESPMKWFDVLRTRVALLFGRRAVESRMNKEFRLHIDLETEHVMRKEG